MDVLVQKVLKRHSNVVLYTVGYFSVVLAFLGSSARKMSQRHEFEVIFNKYSLLTLRDLSTVQEN